MVAWLAGLVFCGVGNLTSSPGPKKGGKKGPPRWGALGQPKKTHVEAYGAAGLGGGNS